MREAFARYELHAVTIGRVIDEPVVRARYRGELVCEVPGRALADDAPRYVLPAAPPAELELRRAERLDDLAAERADRRHAARAAGQRRTSAAVVRSGADTTT